MKREKTKKPARPHSTKPRRRSRAAPAVCQNEALVLKNAKLEFEVARKALNDKTAKMNAAQAAYDACMATIGVA